MPPRALLTSWSVSSREDPNSQLLDLHDIFVDTIADVYTGPIAWSTTHFFHVLER